MRLARQERPFQSLPLEYASAQNSTAKKSSAGFARCGADGLGRDVSERGGFEKAAHIAPERAALDAAGAGAGRERPGNGAPSRAMTRACASISIPPMV